MQYLIYSQWITFLILFIGLPISGYLFEPLIKWVGKGFVWWSYFATFASILMVAADFHGVFSDADVMLEIGVILILAFTFNSYGRFLWERFQDK